MSKDLVDVQGGGEGLSLDEVKLEEDQSSPIKDISLSLIDDEEKDIEPTQPEIVDRGRSSSHSSTSTVANTELNKLLIVSVSPVKTDGRINILFSRERANTILGEKQGDHVTSHRIFIEFLNNKLKGSKISEIPYIVTESMDRIIPDFVEDSDIRKPETINLRRRKLPDLGIEQGPVLEEVKRLFELGERQDRVTILNDFLYGVMQEYNALEDVSYVRRSGLEGDKGKTEGVLTHQSVCALQAINEQLAVNNNPSDEAQQDLFCKLLSRNGEYVDGAKLLFGSNSIEAIRTHFGLPKAGISTEQMKERMKSDYNGKGNIPEIHRFYEEISVMAKDIDFLAKLTDNCFDFQYRPLPDSAGLRTQHEITRDKDKSDPQKMYTLISRHIAMLSEAFTEIGNVIKGNADLFLNAISKELLENQNWKNASLVPESDTKLTIDDIKTSIAENMDMETLSCKSPIILEHQQEFTL